MPVSSIPPHRLGHRSGSTSVRGRTLVMSGQTQVRGMQSALHPSALPGAMAGRWRTAFVGTRTRRFRPSPGASTAKTNASTMRLYPSASSGGHTRLTSRRSAALATVRFPGSRVSESPSQSARMATACGRPSGETVRTYGARDRCAISARNASRETVTLIRRRLDRSRQAS